LSEIFFFEDCKNYARFGTVLCTSQSTIVCFKNEGPGAIRLIKAEQKIRQKTSVSMEVFCFISHRFIDVKPFAIIPQTWPLGFYIAHCYCKMEKEYYGTIVPVC
jgi:hypothetical protein